MASLIWQDVKKQTLKQCWCKLYPLIMFEEADDSDFEGFGGKRYSVVSELREMGGGVKLSVTDEVLKEWVDVDKDEAVTFTLTDEELINAIIEDNLEKMTEADSEEDGPEPKVAWKDAANGLAVFVKFAEQCCYMSTRDVMSLHCTQNEFLLQRGKSCKQADIRNYFKVGCKRKKEWQTSTEDSDKLK
ncbi:uncharacterized protein LOC143039918 [Oratosquilla oratoria]|uniref:uncharacterized protein LOC143039918 n=1 Tax=Oratosquilla oratoria TaxID=337810 RepID=UPI003F76A914